MGRKEDGVDQQFANVNNEQENHGWHLPIEKPFRRPQGQGRDGDQKSRRHRNSCPFEKSTPSSLLHPAIL